jgi:hypothetical protein
MIKATNFATVAAARPVDRVAARVIKTAGAFAYQSPVKTSKNHTDGPRKAKDCPTNATVKIGDRFGRFTVAAYIGNHKKHGAKWSVRCACGQHEIRYSRAIHRAIAGENADDCCQQCRHVKHLRHRATWLASPEGKRR